MIFAGMDEAGRGALAGPVVAAIVIGNEKIKKIPLTFWHSITDSKKLSAKKRMRIFTATASILDFGIGAATPEEIDRHGIRTATFLAMKRAINIASSPFDYLLIDGKDFFPFSFPHRFIIKGDEKIALIGLASILAKVVRDFMMQQASQKYPQFLFHHHKGYGTTQHLNLLKKGIFSPIHRKTFSPLKELFSPKKQSLF